MTDLVIPPPGKQRLLGVEVLERKGFPRGPKQLWKAALDAGLEVRAAYCVGPWMSRNFTKILEPKCPTILVAARGPQGIAWALWIYRNEKWAFESARQTHPDVRSLSSYEIVEWAKR